MMEFDEGSSVLFVGEGDFSFTEALSRHNCFVNVEVVATCYQKELTDRAIVNVRKLEEKGVEVIPGIDATELHNNGNFKDRKFSTVVFNFPHVGGKMKIHLNRNLLYDLFKSVTHILMEAGQIAVTLCAGQGGISLDPVVRRWDDTWQVVLMASCADLILRKVKQFDASLYCGYSATGYRSLEKGFTQAGAITYFFERGPSEIDSLNTDVLCTEEVLLCNGKFVKFPYFMSSQIKRNLCSDSSTLIGQLCSLVKNNISKSVTLEYGKNILGDGNMEIRNILKHYIRDLPVLNDRIAYVHPLYILKRAPMFEIDILLVFVYFETINPLEAILLENTLEVRNFSKSFCSHHKSFEWYNSLLGPYTIPISPCYLGMPVSSGDCYKDLCIFAVNLKELAKSYFEVDADEIWAYGQDVKVDSNCITYSPYSLFPLEYEYDLSFWQCNVDTSDDPLYDGDAELLSEDQMDSQISLDLDAVGVIIVNVAQDALIDYKLLSTYFHPGHSRRSFTFRIRYRSFYRSLSDCKAKKIHSDIGLMLEECLGVEVR